MKFRHNHSIHKQIIVLLLVGLCTMMGHSLVHVLNVLPVSEEAAHNQELPYENNSNEKQEECPECVLVSLFSSELPDNSHFLPEKSGFLEKEISYHFQTTTSYGFSLRAPPLTLTEV